jgi:potassium-transporting ATPase KdpC subunit
VASKRAEDLKRDPVQVQKEIEQILEENASAPFGGLAGEKFVNVLELNLELDKRYGKP